MKYALLDEDDVVIQVQPYHQAGFIEVPDSVVCGQIKQGEYFITPPPTFSVEKLKQYRDQKMASIVTYNGVEVINTVENQDTVTRIINFILTLPEEQRGIEIDWKGPNGWHKATLADFQGLTLQGGLLTQKAFTAEKTILDNHAQTPYTDDSWKDDFDNLMEV